MNEKEFIQLLFEKGKQAGLSDMEVYLEGNHSTSIKVFMGELDNYNISDERIVSVRGIYKERMGYSYTEKMDASTIDFIIYNVMESSMNNNSEDKEYIKDNSCKYEKVDAFSSELAEVKPEEKIRLIMGLEKRAFTLDDRIKASDYCYYEEEDRYRLIKNTRGLELESRSNSATAYLSVVAKADEAVKTGSSFYTGNSFSDIDIQRLASGAVGDAVGMLESEIIESGNYEIILRNDVAAFILEAFIPVFYADRVQKNLSILKDKRGNKIANDIVNLIDDPLMKNGARSRGFDDEGTPTKTKHVIKSGILETYLYNSKSAARDGVESTGNGIRASHKASIGTAPTNMYIESGKHSIDELIESVQKGIMIIDVQGIHAGINPISGDFSLSSYGHLIENGKISRPVNQITIAGNFCTMLQDIEIIGNDLIFKLPYNGYIGSPSLKIKSLTVAGE